MKLIYLKKKKKKGKRKRKKDEQHVETPTGVEVSNAP